METLAESEHTGASNWEIVREGKLNKTHKKKTIKIKQQITYEGAVITIKPKD